jgi:hypothetical protein
MQLTSSSFQQEDRIPANFTGGWGKAIVPYRQMLV